MLYSRVTDAVQWNDQSLSAAMVRAWIRDKLLKTAKKVNMKPKKGADDNIDIESLLVLFIQLPNVVIRR